MSVSTDDDDAAARWAIRLDGDMLSEAEEIALDEWLGGSERRRAALFRAEAALAYLDRSRAFAAPPDVRRRAPPTRRRRFLFGCAMATLAATVGFGIFLMPQTLTLTTGLGEVRRVPLPDGSVASLNTATRIAFDEVEKKRIVRLDKGEAWFQVAKDNTRRFIVEVGDIRVRAVGTAFAVRVRDGGADIMVTEGVVETWIIGHEAERRRIAAGSKSFVDASAASMEMVSAADDIDRALAWRTGEVALNGESLAYAAAELNRYNRRKIVIEDESLGKEPLIGYFRTDQPENFARAVGTMVNATVTIEGDTIRLSDDDN